MKSILFSLVCVLSLCETRAKFIYEESGIEEYRVCTYDTVLFNPHQQYEAYGYSGDAPLFMQVWYPCNADTSSTPLNYGQLGGSSVPKQLDSVWVELKQRERATGVAYHISETFPEYEEADYGPYSFSMILDSMLELPTRSYHRIPRESFTQLVLVYHHGSQGLAVENHVMAELFASRGWVVISGAYHLPFPDRAYGLTDLPFDQESFAIRVLQYARELNREGFVAYAGHSWGAQIGWRILWEEGLADAFVSMETTIEFKEKMSVIEDYWPEVYNVLVKEDKQVASPVLVIANTGTDEAFPFFMGKGRGLQVHATAKQLFTHESYTSAMLWRTGLGEHISFSDRVFLMDQTVLYHRHLDLINGFLRSVKDGNSFDEEQYSGDFYLHTLSR